MNVVEVGAEVQNVGIVVGGSVRLSKSSSVGVDLLQVGLIVHSGHGISKGNQGNGGSLPFKGMELVGGEGGSQTVSSILSSVNQIIKVSDLPWVASNSSINRSNKSVIRGVNLEHNVGNSELLQVLGVVLSSLSIGIDQVGCDDVISGIHVDQREISGGGAGFSINCNSKGRGNDGIAGDGALDKSEEGNCIAISVLPEVRSLSLENDPVNARSCLQTSLSVVEKGKSVSVGSKPNSNS